MRAHTLPYGTSASNGFHFTRTLVVNHRRQCRLWEEDKKTVFWQIQLAHRWAGRFPEISEFDSVPLVRAMDKPTSLTSALDSSPITLATTRLTDCAATSAPDSGKGITCLWTGLCIQLSQLPDLNMLMWQRHFFHWQSGMAIRYSLFLTPPELSRGHNSKPASLQACKHQNFVTRHALSTFIMSVKPSLHPDMCCLKTATGYFTSSTQFCPEVTDIVQQTLFCPFTKPLLPQKLQGTTYSMSEH